jgi:splicing factor 3B subunit 2
MPGVIAEPVAKARKPTKNEQRRAKKKQQKREVSASTLTTFFLDDADATQAAEAPETTEQQVIVEDPAAAVNGDDAAATTQPAANGTAQNEPEEMDGVEVEGEVIAEEPLAAEYANVFKRFTAPQPQETAEEPADKPKVFFDDDDNIQDEEQEAETVEQIKKSMSKRARKEASKLSIAELKAIVKKPEVVDWTDTSAQDPKLLVNIKSSRNVVPVPSHWSLKREYLSSKRGIEKPPFALPTFIAETGISEMRDAVLEKQAEASLKQRQRERVQGKTGRLNIDYQVLYDAFFRRQTKPKLTGFGEVYYEGKEHEVKVRDRRPGELSDELREALNIPPGAPPPWLLVQQKIGPPPSYPALKIPGVNAPIPLGASWGFQPGGYGKPPINEEDGKPMWDGDLFGTAGGYDQVKTQEEEEEEKKLEAMVDKTLFGELAPVEDKVEEEEEDDEEEEEGDGEGTETPFTSVGTETPGGITSAIPTDLGGTYSNMEEFTLRKQRRGTETEESHHPRSAGTVLQERNIRSTGFFGGEKAYDLQATAPMLGQDSRKRKAGGMDVSVDVDMLAGEGGLSKEEMNKLYEQQRQQEDKGGWQGGMKVDQEDLTQLFAEESAKRQKIEEERRARASGGGRGGRGGRR